jgi:hypothetical protein
MVDRATLWVVVAERLCVGDGLGLMVGWLEGVEAGELLCIDAGASTCWNEAVHLCAEVVAVTMALAVHVAPGGTCLKLSIAMLPVARSFLIMLCFGEDD